jgi:hypothetical protein
MIHKVRKVLVPSHGSKSFQRFSFATVCFPVKAKIAAPAATAVAAALIIAIPSQEKPTAMADGVKSGEKENQKETEKQDPEVRIGHSAVSAHNN